MSDIKSYKLKLVKSLLNAMGAIFMRRSESNKPDFSSEEIDSKIDSIIDSYTSDLISTEPYSPIKFNRWVLKNATTHTDKDGFLSWEIRGEEVDTEKLYSIYKDSLGLEN
jgi:hypothetical protein